MRTFFLLLLTFVTINGSLPNKNNVEKMILGEAITKLNMILNHRQNVRTKTNLNQLVKNIHEVGKECSAKTLCRTAEVLTSTYLKGSILQRGLSAYASYTGHHNCHVSGREQIKLRELLQHTKDCCQKLYSA